MPQAADPLDVLHLVNGELVIAAGVNIGGALAVGSGLAVNGSATVLRVLTVQGGTVLGDTGLPLALTVRGQSELDATTVCGPLVVEDRVTIAKDLAVQGRTVLGSSPAAAAAAAAAPSSRAALAALVVHGSAAVDSSLRVGQNATVGQVLAVDGPLTTGGLATFTKGSRTLGRAAAEDLAVSGQLSAPDMAATRLNVTALLTSLGSTSLGSGAGTALVVSGPATFNAEILAAAGATITEELSVASLEVAGALSVGGNLTVAKSTVLGASSDTAVIAKGAAQLGAATVLGRLEVAAANITSAIVGRLAASSLAVGSANVTGAAQLLDGLRVTGNATLGGSLEVNMTLSVLNADGQDSTQPALQVLGAGQFEADGSAPDGAGGTVPAHSVTLVEPGRMTTLREVRPAQGPPRRYCYQGLRLQDLLTLSKGMDGLAALPCATTKTDCSWARGRNTTGACQVPPPTSTCCAVV
ncbi:hypothetical protein ABPG75_007394 [Micractinium tetrahymenae]